MSHYRNIFNLFADSSNNTVKKSDLSSMLAYACLKISPADLAEIQKDELTFDEFKTLAQKLKYSAHSFEAYKKAFETYDPNQTGFIHFKIIVDFCKIKQGFLDEEDEDELLESFLPDKNGMVNYIAVLKDFFEDSEESSE